VLRLAHRGDHRLERENTLAALRAALAVSGCDGIEFDVRASSDGQLVLLHDETLSRVFGRPEPATGLTARALGAIGVPTLAEALAVADPPAFLDVELKVDVVEPTVRRLAEGRGDPPDRVVISSFDPRVLAHVSAVAPGWPIWLNTRDLGPAAVGSAVRVGCAGIAAPWRTVGPASLQRASEAGLVVAAWTVRRRPTLDRLEGLGVTAVCVEGRALDPG
jgi:glycerophosphoryl diester phosphodiesterase